MAILEGGCIKPCAMHTFICLLQYKHVLLTRLSLQLCLHLIDSRKQGHTLCNVTRRLGLGLSF